MPRPGHDTQAFLDQKKYDHEFRMELLKTYQQDPMMFWKLGFVIGSAGGLAALFLTGVFPEDEANPPKGEYGDIKSFADLFGLLSLGFAGICLFMLCMDGLGVNFGDMFELDSLLSIF